MQGKNLLLGLLTFIILLGGLSLAMADCTRIMVTMVIKFAL